ncbi:MAG: DUF1232 domain-containing protein [Bacteroidales bacterium]|nr:DUF1232 domain-containing protein [Bacteroidales bacterium]
MLKRINIDIFKNNISAYAGHYNPTALFDKIKVFARKLGIKSVYGLLILYYATFDKSLPLKDRIMVMAALGYFILPLDILPDALPGGFADDMAAATYVLKHIWSNLSPMTAHKAASRLREWFDNVTDEDLRIPGL